MRLTFLNCLSVAACIAVASPDATAQGAGSADVRVVRERGPRPGVDIERRLAEVIELLEVDELTPARRAAVKANLKALVERVRREHHHEGELAEVWEVAPVEDVIQVDGDVVVEVTPEAGIRTRVRRAREDADVADRTMALRGRVEGLRRTLAEVEAQAPRAPRAPKPPKAAKAPKVAMGLAMPKVDAPEDAEEDVRLRVVRTGRGEGGRVLHLADVDAESEHRMRVREERSRKAVAKASAELQLMLDRERAANDERRAVVLRKVEAEESVEAVREQPQDDDLRAMVDEMRAELREVRTLLKSIRKQSQVDGAGAEGGGRLMRQ